MPEERPVVEDRIAAQLGRIAEDVADLKRGQNRMTEAFAEMDRRLTSDVAGLKAGFEQMDKRVTSLDPSSAGPWGSS